MAERGQTDNQSRMDQEGRGMNPSDRSRQDDISREGSDSSREDSSGRKTSNRGFAAMDPEKQKRIASEGGRAAHRQGVAHEWNRDEARQAGRKGGQTVSQNREHMSEIGRKGGQSSGQRRQRTGGERGEQ
ncbi:MAG TPA: KGG domain-containing protein [Flavisolibacter sp.]|nr:KGG domain-containing protein [Flavisolibacter sp.]